MAWSKSLRECNPVAGYLFHVGHSWKRLCWLRPRLSGGFLFVANTTKGARKMSKLKNARLFIELMNGLIPKHIETSIKIIMSHDNSKELCLLSNEIFREYALFGRVDNVFRYLKTEPKDIEMFVDLFLRYIARPINPNLATMITMRTNLLNYCLEEHNAIDQNIDYKILSDLTEYINPLTKPPNLPPLIQRDNEYRLFYLMPNTDSLYLSFFQKNALLGYLGILTEDLNKKITLGYTLDNFEPKKINMNKIRKEIKEVKFLA